MMQCAPANLIVAEKYRQRRVPTAFSADPRCRPGWLPGWSALPPYTCSPGGHHPQSKASGPASQGRL